MRERKNCLFCNDFYKEGQDKKNTFPNGDVLFYVEFGQQIAKFQLLIVNKVPTHAGKIATFLPFYFIIIYFKYNEFRARSEGKEVVVKTLFYGLKEM